jgi:hypothetical protein
MVWGLVLDAVFVSFSAYALYRGVLWLFSR